MEKMSYPQFQQYVLEHISSYLPSKYQDRKPEIRRMVKNGVSNDALCFLPEGDESVPALDLNDCYAHYEEGEELNPLMMRIGNAFVEPVPDVNLDSITDYEKAKDRIFVRVGGLERNQDVVQSAPHKIIADLVMTCHVWLKDLKGAFVSTMIDNNLLEHYEVSEEELFEQALKSSAKLLPVRFASMHSIYMHLDGRIARDDELPKRPYMMYVTNEREVNGASALFYDGVLEKAAECMGGSFYAFPSSVHEFVLCQKSDNDDVAFMQNMVKQINAEHVDIHDQLSDSVYYYDAETKEFAVAHPEKE